MSLAENFDMHLESKENLLSAEFENTSYVTTLPFGCLDFYSARKLQQGFIERRIAGRTSDLLLYGEHPLTLSFGKRTSAEEKVQLKEIFSRETIAFVEADRGGVTTLHGPGQLVIYPVISLRERRIGVRDFVGSCLETIASAIRDLGINAKACLKQPGVWVVAEGADARPRKIVAVGLRICRGVTSHGFSVNINCDLRPFSLFSPCGLKNVNVTSLQAEGLKLDTEFADGMSAVSAILISRLENMLWAPRRLGA